MMLLPLLLLICASWFRQSQGPMWQTPDPTYAYLLNALSLAEGHVPLHNDHPGVPVQAIGAVVLRVADVLTGGKDFAGDVVARHVAYADLYFKALLLLLVFSSAACGAVLLAKTGNLPLALLPQIAPFLARDFFVHSLTVNSDVPLIAVSLVVGTVALLHGMERLRSPSQAAVLYGVIIGFGIATKLTAAIFIAIPLMAFTSSRARRLFLLTLAGSTLVWTLPIVTRYGHVLRWAWRLTARTGPYGTGPVGVPSIASLSASLYYLVATERFVFLCVAAAVAVSIMFFARIVAGFRDSIWIRIHAAALLCEGVLILAATRHASSRYLFVLVGLLPLTVWFSLRLARWDANRRLNWLVPFAFVLLLLFQGLWWHRWSVFFDQRRHEYDTFNALSAEAAAAGPVVFFGDARSDAYAVLWGDGTNGNRYTSAIARVYPRARIATLQTLKETCARAGERPGGDRQIDVVIHTDAGSVEGAREALGPGFDLVPLREGRFQALYKLSARTRPNGIAAK